MPKMKTHKATAKRVRVTKTGKLIRKMSGAAHIMAKKSSRRKRRLNRTVELARADYKRTIQLIAPAGRSLQ